MKRSNKLIGLFLIITLIATVFCISSYATSEPVSDSVKFTFDYTSDSVITEGLTYRTYSDPVTNQIGFEIVPDFGIGYTIYDNPETEIIDGIRINGLEVTSLIIPVTADTEVFEYNIAVKTVYKEDASGDFARILDGTYDYTNLLTNPVIVLQIVYWALMAVTGFLGLVYLIKYKSKRIKSSDEIASKVVENRKEFEERLIEVVTKIVKAEIVPLAQASVKSGKEAVKAIVLATSKSKEAPMALLDVFKESSDISISGLVDSVRQELANVLEHDYEQHATNAAALHNIANNVIQEDVTDATQENNISKHSKSIF